jgi:hypothetical protein
MSCFGVLVCALVFGLWRVIAANREENRRLAVQHRREHRAIRRRVEARS